MDISLQELLLSTGQILSSALPLAGTLLCFGLFRQWRRNGSWPLWHANIGSLRARHWQTADVFLLLFAIMLPVAAAFPSLFRTATSASAPSGKLPQIATLLAYYPLLLLAVGVAAQRTMLGIGTALGITRQTLWPSIRTGFIWGLAMLPPVLVTAGLTDSICQWLGTPPSRQAVFDVLELPGQSAVLQGLLIFIAIVAAPLAEEAIFRGVLLPCVLRHCGIGVALLLVNTLFALLHLHAPSFLPLLVVGICLSLGMLNTGSVLTPIVMHAVFNGEMLLLFYAWS